MDYLEGLRNIILNELNIGGQEVQEENDDDNGDQNFMDDDDNPPAEEPTPAEDAPAPNEGGDDTSDDGDQNFMDDDDGGDDAPTEDAPTDDGSSDDGDQNFMDDEGDTSDTGEEPSSDDGSTEDAGGEDDGDQNFMDDGGGEGGDSAEGGDDSGSEETSEDGEDQQEGEEQPEGQDYDINKIEDELFSSLTPEQIAIKNHELKDQFIELYSIIGSTLVRINDISKSNENINVLKFITEKLLELREMIDFNITTAYQTRTYIENNIIYQQCIATLNAIADIIDNIPKLDGRDEDQEEDEEDKNGISVEDDDEEEVKALDVSDTSVSNYQEESTDYNSLF
nr:MAG TPA: hypothetical protein [Caudoviricetes sp.]